MRADTTTPDTRLADDPMKYNPASVSALVELMMGGWPPDRRAPPLFCRVRYFDPIQRRAGIPEDVAALVEGLSSDGMKLTLINVNQVEPRIVVLQGGAYGEHQLKTVTLSGTTHQIESPTFRVRLAPGAGTQFEVKMARYTLQPTMKFPWDREPVK